MRFKKFLFIVASFAIVSSTTVVAQETERSEQQSRDSESRDDMADNSGEQQSRDSGEQSNEQSNQQSNEQSNQQSEEQSSIFSFRKSMKANWSIPNATVLLAQVGGYAAVISVALHLLYRRLTVDNVKPLPILYTAENGKSNQDVN
ncbi:MAG: hypothetical protein BEN18_06295 [Epulopiscium sp. Nuni2H_MBin001]|nr:MAG: hypothetical protein BEN18_06295 [Epulopiscium sp. Nuni2H_MBin001]